MIDVIKTKKVKDFSFATSKPCVFSDIINFVFKDDTKGFQTCFAYCKNISPRGMVFHLNL